MLLDTILQRGQSSRLYQSLVYEQQLAAQVGSGFRGARRSPGVYTLLAILSEGKSADDGVKSLQAEIAKIRDTPVSAAELEEARNELLAEALAARETSDGRADRTGALGDPVQVIRPPPISMLAQLQTVTAADVQRVAKSIMDDTRSVTIRYLPEAGGREGRRHRQRRRPSRPCSVDIPAAEIPTYALAPEDKRQQPPAAGAAQWPPRCPPPREKTLANGLRVIVANRPGLPLVAANLSIAAGGALDPADRAGLASMTADLTTRGTATRSATDISREVESLGASLGARRECRCLQRVDRHRRRQGRAGVRRHGRRGA